MALYFDIEKDSGGVYIENVQQPTCGCRCKIGIASLGNTKGRVIVEMNSRCKKHGGK